jgi:hypothetical protein
MTVSCNMNLCRRYKHGISDILYYPLHSRKLCLCTLHNVMSRYAIPSLYQNIYTVVTSVHQCAQEHNMHEPRSARKVRLRHQHSKSGRQRELQGQKEVFTCCRPVAARCMTFSCLKPGVDGPVTLLNIVPLGLEFGGRYTWKSQSNLGYFPHEL